MIFYRSFQIMNCYSLCVPLLIIISIGNQLIIWLLAKAYVGNVYQSPSTYWLVTLACNSLLYGAKFILRMPDDFFISYANGKELKKLELSKLTKQERAYLIFFREWLTIFTFSLRWFPLVPSLKNSVWHPRGRRDAGMLLLFSSVSSRK